MECEFDEKRDRDRDRERKRTGKLERQSGVKQNEDVVLSAEKKSKIQISE